jgi:hypothetical protein
MVGMGDERLTVAAIAERLNIAPGTWRSYVARGQAPPADGWFDRRTPWWSATTVKAWADARPRRQVSGS